MFFVFVYLFLFYIVLSLLVMPKRVTGWVWIIIYFIACFAYTPIMVFLYCYIMGYYEE